MVFGFGSLISPKGDGNYKIRLAKNIIELIVWLAEDLDKVLDEDTPNLTRLFPTAYADDPEMDAGYQILARDQLVDQRREAIDIVRSTAENSILNEEELAAWMRVVNDLRLVIGTRLDVSEDDHDLNENDPNADLMQVYHLLGIVLSDIVEALTTDLPNNTQDSD